LVVRFAFHARCHVARPHVSNVTNVERPLNSSNYILIFLEPPFFQRFKHLSNVRTCFVRSGLDDLSSLQCVRLLKTLAKGGRTVICSVHTPSAKLFSEFDHVYIVAEGQCVYQGEGDGIVPFLKSLSLPCPKTYNPADYSKFSLKSPRADKGYLI